jgi:hypothetical protein
LRAALAAILCLWGCKPAPQAVAVTGRCKTVLGSDAPAYDGPAPATNAAFAPACLGIYLAAPDDESFKGSYDIYWYEPGLRKMLQISWWSKLDPANPPLVAGQRYLASATRALTLNFSGGAEPVKERSSVVFKKLPMLPGDDETILSVDLLFGDAFIRGDIRGKAQYSQKADH